MSSNMTDTDEETTTSAGIPTKHFHIFGLGISFSKSPEIHGAGFRHYGLPHTYDIQQPVQIDDVQSLIEDDNFGGASVTMPHKTAVHRFCQSQTEHARSIGAINTLVVQRGPNGERWIEGENTDWAGLHSLVLKYTESWKTRPNVGLVIGAGGAARSAVYALHQAGLTELYIVNRTVSNAVAIAKDFQETFDVSVLPDLSGLPHLPDVVIGTIPANVTKEQDFEPLFRHRSERGLCIDMAYNPRRTPLLALTARQPGWITVPGVEVLLNQAFVQFEIWTGLVAPQAVMTEAIENTPKDRMTPAGRL